MSNFEYYNNGVVSSQCEEAIGDPSKILEASFLKILNSRIPDSKDHYTLEELCIALSMKGGVEWHHGCAGVKIYFIAKSDIEEVITWILSDPDRRRKIGDKIQADIMRKRADMLSDERVDIEFQKRYNTVRVCNNCRVEYLEWENTRGRKFEAHAKMLEGVKVSIKGKTATIFLDNGKTLTKRTSAKGFHVYDLDINERII